jgi:hypothetical protein
MANQLAEMPWSIDTPQAAPFFTTELDIVHFELAQYTLDTDNVIVKNKNGNVVWAANGEADLSPVISQKIGWINGMIVDTLTAGAVLRVYFK